jgi:hypothetical protein
MKKAFTRILSVTLSLIMAFSTVQPALGYYAGDAAADDGLTLTDENGNAAKVSELWDETYPFGAFAFDVTALGMAEGEDAVVTVYRAGGTRGRATAYIAYSPLLTPNEDESIYYGYGLSGEDLTLEVEDPLPIAQYQALGKYPNPERGDASIIQGQDSEGYVLSLSEDADSYQWQAFYDGEWVGIVKAEAATLPMDAEYIDSGEYDYRCIYMKDGVRYCTDSLRGIEYVQEPEEVLEPMPDDIELNPEPTYTAIALDDKDDLYSGWLFELTFADGEYKKEIHIHANTDDASELMESATFRIAYCKGGDIYSGSETLLLHVDDKNESTPSAVGFTVSSITVDKAEGFAEVLVRRVGGVERAVSVEYATADGSAVAGKDYVAASGTLMFYGNVTELPVKIELIDDQMEQDAPLSFTISLSELKGDDKCSMAVSEATVSLINSGTGEATNLASVLYDAETVDLSSVVTEAPTAANSGLAPVTGEQVEMDVPEPVELELVPVDASDLGTQSFSFPNNAGIIQFTNPKSNVFKASEDLAVYANFNNDGNGGTLYEPGEKTNELGGTDGGGYHGAITIQYGIALGSDHHSSRTMKTDISDYIGQYYSGFTAIISAYYAHDTSFYKAGGYYLYSWTEPRLEINGAGVNIKEPSETKREGSGALNKNWKIYGKVSGTSSWDNPVDYVSVKKTFSGTGKVSIKLNTPYHSTGDHEHDDLNAESLIQLHKLQMTRRYFKDSAFSVDISTPNDANTAPDGCTKITDYQEYLPKVEIISGGVQGNTNSVFVGSTIKITPKGIPSYSVSKICVMRYVNGKWVSFNKFKQSNDSKTGAATVELIANPNDPLTVDEINSQYRFRVVYERSSAVNVDLRPSLPRDENGTQLASEVCQLFNKYTKDSQNKSTPASTHEDHDFTTRVKYGYSEFDNDNMDYKTVVTEGNTTTSLAGCKGGTTWSLTGVKNLQWIEFTDLPAGDMLLINGTAYPGNARIYLKESDITGALNILYYHSSYQSFINSMDTAISWVQLYFDGDGDGKISGFLGDNGLIHLSDGSKDEYICEVRDGDTFNEMQLTPVDLGNGKYGQYFFQICYTMTPRCLQPVKGEENNKAQILPAITTAVDPDSTAYKDLTKEQKQYNYVVSGKDSSEKYTSDNHEMFGAKANAKTILSIPAGGDKAPAHLDESGAVYEWNPNWYENNLFTHAAPELVIIKNSVAGETKAAEAEVKVTEKANNEFEYAYDYKDNQAEINQMNGYLASLTGTSRIAMVSQIQQAETASLKNKNDTYPVKPDSVTVGKFSTSPDAEYLKVMKSDGQQQEPLKMQTDGEGKSEMSEFSMPFDMNFGGNEVAVTDYVTILFDENSVGFAISLPLCGYEKEGSGQGEKKGFADTNRDAWTQFGDFFKEDKFNDSSLKDAYQKKNSRNNNQSSSGGGGGNNQSGGGNNQSGGGNNQGGGSNSGQEKTVKSSKFSVSLSVSAAFIWQYNPLDNGYYFSQFEVGIAGELEFRAQARLTVFPPVYGYIDVSFALEIKTGLGVIRTAEEGNEILSKAVELAHYDSNYKGNKNKQLSYTLETTKKALDIEFEGKLYVYVQVKKGNEAWQDADDYDKDKADNNKLKFTSGTIGSDGSEVTQLVLRQQDGMELPTTNAGDNNLTYRVIFIPMDQSDKEIDTTTIKSIHEIESIRDFVHWNGISISPELAFEIGMGIGAELLKLELYIHISVGATFTFGKYNDAYNPNRPDVSKEKAKQQNIEPNYMYEDASVESFEFNVGLGIRAVLLFFTYELDLVSYQVTYDGDKWEYGWHFLNDMVENELNERDAGVTVSLPQNKANTMRFYSPEDNAGEGFNTQAYNVGAPFQVSGFSSSVNAAALSDDIPEGSSYKVVRAGQRNFIVFTASRPATAAEDSTMLVLSELGYIQRDGKSVYGLVNPVNRGESTPYIVLDNDKTGDLDFDISVEKGATNGNDTNYTIHAAWVSYATPSNLKPAPTKPSEAANNGINADNYTNFANLATATDINGQWYKYYLDLNSYNTYLQARAKAAAENTIVKTADWSFTETAVASSESTTYTYTNNSAFTVPKTANASHYVFLPAASENGDVLFFASTHTPDDGTAYNDYAAYQDGKTNLDAKVKNYLKSTKKANLDVFGTQSALNVVFKDGDNWSAIHSATLPEGETLANVEFTKGKDSGSYYVAYTTEKTAYESGNLVTVYRMYLQKLTVNTNTGNVAWGARYGIRTLKDYDKKADNQKDGVYGNAQTPSQEYESPYLSNLSFLTAKIDAAKLTGAEDPDLTTQAAEEQTILVFEMNGASYIIPQESLDAILNNGDSAKKKLYPFFTPPTQYNAEGEAVTEGSSGKLQVNINADEAGNLYAVYLASVPGTTNNALYLSTYDTTVNQWGDGIMLAMHDMDTYEASVRYNWDLETTEAAYLYGKLGHNGISETSLKALYGSEAYNTVKNHSVPADLGDAKSFNFSSIQTVQGSNNDLLAVTIGSLRELTVDTYTVKDKQSNNEVTKYVVVPTTQNNAIKSTVGTYVVSFGQGEKKLGDANIAFEHKDFSAGSQLHVSLSAKNVGTTAIRGSESQPITATLTAKGQELATWVIKDNIVSGQELIQTLSCTPLESRLVNGDKFTLTLQEDQSYTNSAPVSIELFTVEEKPDLSVERMELYPVSVSEDGKTTTMNVSFVAANQGSADATGVYAQFSYKDKDGDYKPLNLTGHNLTVDQETSLDTLLKTQDVDTDLDNGILALESNDHNGNLNRNIGTGYGKLVHGTIEVPSSAFAADESGHVQIKVELFSNTDTITSMNAGLREAKHNEYYTANNLSTQSVEAYTAFNAAHSIVIPLGSTTRVPVVATSSRGTKPVISVEEIENEDGLNIGILNFKENSQSANASGKVSGYISVTPTKTGTGVIHITDTDTNTTFSIAFEVTDSEDGIDIYKDNGSFTFYNANGTEYDDKATVAQSWTFPGVNEWGTGNTAETPLRNNLAVAKNGAYFTFNSVAETIDLYFKGKIKVTSTNPRQSTVVLENSTGGNVKKEISLGENADNSIFEVRIDVLEDNTAFDRLAESYHGNVVPVPSYDGANPYFIWSRSFPATGSVSTSASIPLKLYVLDNNGIANISVNGIQFSDPDIANDAVTSMDANQLLWCYDFGSVSANGKYTVVATDISGNTSTETLLVDWFLANPTGDIATVKVPEYTASFYNGDSLLGSTVIKDTNNLKVKFAETAGNTKSSGNSFEVYFFNGDGFDTVTEATGTWPVAKNGLYWTRAINTDNTWSAEVINLTQIDSELPVATLGYDAQTVSLKWAASKKASAAANIQEVAINGYNVNTTTGKDLSGSLPVSYSGSYALTANDGVNAKVTQTATIDAIGITLPASFAPTTTGVTDEVNPNGTVSANLAGIVGGYYDSALSNEANNEYKSKYTAVLVKASDITAEQLANDAARSAYIAALTNPNTANFEGNSWTHTWNGLEQGDYKLIISDAGDGGLTSEFTHFSTVADVYVPGELPRVTAAANSESNRIVWTATKDAAAVNNINSVTVNSYTVSTATGKDLSGSFDIAFSGKYTVAAKDVNDKSDSKDVTAAGVSIVLPANAESSTAVWDNTRANGAITLNLEGTTGGYYDSAASVIAENKYYGKYSAILITPEMLGKVDSSIKSSDEELLKHLDLFSAAQKEVLSKDNWTHTWNELEPGEHIIIITDMGDGGLDAAPAERASAVIRVNVGDERVKISGVTLNATAPGRNDGKLVIRSVGGSTGLLEYALIPSEELDKEVLEEDAVKNYKELEKEITELKQLIADDPEKASEKASELKAKQAELETAREALASFFIGYAKANPDKVSWTLSDYGLTSSTQKSTFDDFFASDYKDIAPYILSGLASNTNIVDENTALNAAYTAYQNAETELNNLADSATKAQRAEKQEALDAAKKVLVDAFKAYAEADPDSINWLLDDYTFKNNIQGRTFEELVGGDYYVIARKVYGDIDTSNVTAKHNALDSAYSAYKAAKELCSTLEKKVEATKAIDVGSDKDKEKEKNEKLSAAQEALKAAEEQLEQAKEAFDAAYEAYCEAINSVSSAEYATMDNYWNGADVISVVVNSNPRRVINSEDEKAETDSVSDISLSENGSVVFTVKAGEPLSAADQAKILEANATAPVIISNEKVSVAMPAGTVTTEGFDINLMIADTSKAKPGMIVEYTDKNGNVKADILCVVGEGSASYVASEEGTYRVVAPNTDFADIGGLWSEDSIKFVTGRKMFLGTGDGKFSPASPMSRAMFVTVLWRVAGSPAQSDAAPFSDLTADWCADAVSWASKLGIVSGYSDGRFGQDDPVTREQMCVFITRSMEKLGWKLSADNKHGSFNDAASISDWAGSAVDTCADIGLINGFENGSFAPQNKATRGETSAILERFVQKVVEYLCK